MSAFDDIFTGAREAVFEIHASDVTWTKADGTAVPTRAILCSDTQKTVDEMTGQILSRARAIELLTAAVPDPNRGDTIRIDGVDWCFSEVVWRQAGVVCVNVVRSEQAEITHQNYRR